MARWVEWHNCVYAIQSDQPNTIISQTIRKMKTYIYVTDDLNDFTLLNNAGVSQWLGKIKMSRYNELMAFIHSMWEDDSPPSGMPHEVWYWKPSGAQSSLAWTTLRNLKYSWYSPLYSYAWVPQNITRNAYVYSVFDDAYHSVGTAGNYSSTAGVAGFQLTNFPTPVVRSNYMDYNRVTFGFIIAYRNPSTNAVTRYAYVNITQDTSDRVQGDNDDTLTWYAGVVTTNDFIMNEFTARGKGWVQGDDPYIGIVPPSGGDEGPSEGDGDFGSDDVPEPDPLDYSSANTGFTRIYNPSLAQLQDFSYYLWTDGSLLSTLWNHIKQFFEDPMDAFIALNLLPVQVPNGDPEEVKLLFWGTGKSMNPALNQFVTVDCGEVELSEKYGSALDYSPNTKIDLFLPFIGTVPIDTDEVMGKTVRLTYIVDICTGICVAILKAKMTLRDSSESWIPLYQYSGNCAIRIPFSSANMDGYINAGMQVAKLAAGAITGGLAGAAAAAATSAQNSNTSMNKPSEPVEASGHGMNFAAPARTPGSVQAQMSRDTESQSASKYSNLATVTRAAAAGIGIATGAKAGFPHTSGFAGNAGYMGYKVPFFIIKCPRLVNPEQYGKFNGRPSLTYQLFSDLSGYTEIQQVQLTNINATANELDEIQSLLKSGVIM